MFSFFCSECQHFFSFFYLSLHILFQILGIVYLWDLFTFDEICLRLEDYCNQK